MRCTLHQNELQVSYWIPNKILAEYVSVMHKLPEIKIRPCLPAGIVLRRMKNKIQSKIGEGPSLQVFIFFISRWPWHCTNIFCQKARFGSNSELAV